MNNSYRKNIQCQFKKDTKYSETNTPNEAEYKINENYQILKIDKNDMNIINNNYTKTERSRDTLDLNSSERTIFESDSIYKRKLSQNYKKFNNTKVEKE